MIQGSIKILMSILFLLCLLHMPYGYYQAVRFIGMIGFILLAYLTYQQDKKMNLYFIAYIGLALLFQPFLKIALGRTGWNIVDILVSMFLILSLFKKS
jgi:hypothetical protein